MLEKLTYDCKYTLGSYADALISVPISLAKRLSSNWETCKANSPTYRLRESLRDKLDTEPGVKYLQSNVVGAIPFFVVGMPAAEAAESLIELYSSEMGELTKGFANSICTLTAQMVVGYSGFMANEIRNNPTKYRIDGKLNSKKMVVGFGNVIKAFLKFDLTYAVAKTALQTHFLFVGKDPWKASGIADSIATPLWYLVTIPLGLRNGIIEAEGNVHGK
jgi:hypothetical protein